MISDHPTSGGVHIFDNFIDPENASLIEKFILKHPKIFQNMVKNTVNHLYWWTPMKS